MSYKVWQKDKQTIDKEEIKCYNCTMNKIFNSASKIAFLLMVLAVIGALFLNKINGEQFLILAGMAFSFYFTKSQPITKSE